MVRTLLYKADHVVSVRIFIIIFFSSKIWRSITEKRQNISAPKFNPNMKVPAIQIFRKILTPNLRVGGGRKISQKQMSAVISRKIPADFFQSLDLNA